MNVITTVPNVSYMVYDKQDMPMRYIIPAVCPIRR